MDKPKIELSRTELDFLKRLLLDLQQELGCTRQATDDELVAAIELSLAMLQWDGKEPPQLDAQVGLGAAIQLKLGPDAMYAFQEWRTERRRRTVPVH